MVAFHRLNYNRLNHSLRGLANYLPFTTQKLKPLFIVVISLILVVQLLLLRTPRSSVDTNRVLVIDKNSQVASHYKYLLKKHSENFPSLPLKNKCGLYFKELYNLDHDWELIDPSQDTNKEYNKGTFNKDQFIRDKINEYKKAHNNEEPSDGKKAEFELDFQKALSGTLTAEQSMIDAVTHMRVFGSCYLNDKTSSASQVFSSWFGNTGDDLETLSGGENLEICTNIEQRLFPWLSRELPSFVRWDGETIVGIPKMSNYIDVKGYEQEDIVSPLKAHVETSRSSTEDDETELIPRFAKRKDSSGCFLNTWRNALNGKGLVLSVADKYESDLIGLIRVLRALNNHLPIQLVHKGDLSPKVQERIVEVARSDDVKVPKFLWEKVIDDIPHNFPKQEVWFVNAKRCIRKEFQGNFNGFANKLIAYLFNSFDEMILMDTDSIPLVKPSTFFESGPYKRTQSLFFKDRFNGEKVSAHDSQYFLKLMPGTIDETLFDIPKASNVTLNNRYIKDQYRHVMEAGMVALKRSTHFMGILTSVQLNFWNAASTRIWGDKELFWLGQSISGNENYEFNKYDVVAVGELTPMSDRPRNTIAHELCSTHPGHLSGDDDRTLLWINSGMRFCKVDNTWENDLKQDRFSKYFKSVDELATFYKNPARINAVLIPPGGDRRVENKNNEPARGWEMNSPCKGYLWCAYDIVGGSTDPLDRGSYIEYNNITEYKNEYLGKLWLNQDLLNLKTYHEELEKSIEEERLKKIEEEKAAEEKRIKEEKEAAEKKKQEEEAAEKKKQEEEKKAKAEKEAKEAAEKKAKEEEEAKKKAQEEEEAKKAAQAEAEAEAEANQDSSNIE